MTTQDYLKGVLKLIGVVGAGRDMRPADSADALELFNAFLDSCAADQITILTVLRTVKALTANDGQYSIGTGGDINILRPTEILRWGMIPDSTATTPLEMPMRKPLTAEEYARVAQKTLTSVYPYELYYDKSYASGLGQVHFFPVPTGASVQAVLYTPKAFSGRVAIGDTLDFAPGYEEFVKFNFAIRAAILFGKVLNPAIPILAAQAQERIAIVNLDVPVLRSDVGMPGVSGGFDVRSGL